jgi:hypothetical protein
MAAIASPRVVLIATAVMFAGLAVATVMYPPGYLAIPWLWALLSGVAAVTSVMALRCPGRKRVAVAGATAIVAALSRSLAIAAQVARDPEPFPQWLSFTLASMTWGFVAFLLHALWIHNVLPWAAVQRGR